MLRSAGNFQGGWNINQVSLIVPIADLSRTYEEPLYPFVTLIQNEKSENVNRLIAVFHAQPSAFNFWYS